MNEYIIDQHIRNKTINNNTWIIAKKINKRQNNKHERNWTNHTIIWVWIDTVKLVFEDVWLEVKS